MLRRVSAALLVLATCWSAGCLRAPEKRNGAGRESVVLTEYRQRLEHVRREIPQITATAEVAARRWVEHRQILLHYPFGGDTSNFTMEFIARAGGLDNAQPNTLRQKLRTQNDVIVVGPRSWEKGAEFLRKELADARAAGWLIVVFGSKNGLPADVPVDLLIDNGAATGSEEQAAMNQIVNVTNGWIWCCELTAALTRLGWRPGVLKGMPIAGAVAHNKEYQNTDGLPKLYPCDQPIPAGSLARLYLDGIEANLAALGSEKTQQQIARAAEFAVDHIQSGRTVWASSFTHVLDGEVFVNNRSPIRAFRGISCGQHGETFTKNLREGDLLLFFGEWTINLPWRDYLAIIRQTGADYIPSFRISPEAIEPYDGQEIFYDRKVDDALMVLEQDWPFENAVVPIPFPPGKMAPVSGVHVCLLYRILDQAIAERLATARAPVESPAAMRR